MNADRTTEIRRRLENAFAPELLEIRDDSHMHVGHAGARDGRGHFFVEIVSKKFSGIPRLQQHQLVYDALGDLMQTDIHALQIKASAARK